MDASEDEDFEECENTDDESDDEPVLGLELDEEEEVIIKQTPVACTPNQTRSEFGLSFLDYMKCLKVDDVNNERRIQNSTTENIMITIKELITTRGFHKLQEQAVSCIKSMHGIRADNDDDQSIVVFCMDSFNKLGIQLAREMDAFVCSNPKIVDVVIVTTDGMTSAAKKHMSLLPCDVQSFTEAELVRNYTHHDLVPTQVRLTQSETIAMMQQYKTTKAQLHCMFHTDPIVKFNGWRVGDVIRCTRRLGQAMEPYVIFRVVV